MKQELASGGGGAGQKEEGLCENLVVCPSSCTCCAKLRLVTVGFPALSECFYSCLKRFQAMCDDMSRELCARIFHRRSPNRWADPSQHFSFKFSFTTQTEEHLSWRAALGAPPFCWKKCKACSLEGGRSRVSGCDELFCIPVQEIEAERSETERVVSLTGQVRCQGFDCESEAVRYGC